MARQTEDIAADFSTLIRLGTIESVDLTAAMCTVRLADADADDDAGDDGVGGGGGPVVTPPIRWLCGRAGGTRIWSPPTVGEQVVLLTPDGQIGAAIALTGVVRDAFPPAGSDAVELIEFADGARLSYDADAHVLTADLPDGATANITASGGITLTGNVTIDGDVTVSGKVTASGDVKGAGVSLSTHKHGGVQSGSAKTLPPE